MGKEVKRLFTDRHVAANPGRRAGLADIEIGQRVRSVRMDKGVTQEWLAERLQISCQQLQKYENGANRISAARLVDVSRHLDVDVALLLQDDAPTLTTRKTEVTIGVAGDAVLTAISGQELMDLLRVYCAIPNAEARAKVLEMAKFLGTIELKPD